MMFRTTFTKVLYQKRKMLVWWVVGIMAMTVFTMAFFPTFRDSDISQAFNELPAAVQKLAGDASAYQTINGYVAQQIFSLRLPLLTIILAITLFVGLSARDEQSGRLETQLALPISRARLLAEKMAAGMVILAIACMALAVAVEMGAFLVSETYSWVNAFRASFACFLLSAVAGLVAFMVGSITGNRGATLGIASAVAFGSYLITSLTATVTSLEFLDKFSLFHYYPSGPGLTAFQFGVLGLLGIGFAAIGLIVFSRRDIKV